MTINSIHPEIKNKIFGGIFIIWFVSNTFFWPFSTELLGMSFNLNTFTLLFLSLTYFILFGKIILSKIKIILLLIIIESLIISVIGACNSQIIKSFITAPIFIIVLFTGLSLGLRSTPVNWISLQRVSILLLSILIISFIIEYIYPDFFARQEYQEIYNLDGKFIGSFSEPSLLAVSIIPYIYILALSENKKMKLIGAIFLALIILLSPSTTLLLCSIPLVFIYMNQRSHIFIAILLTSFALLFYMDSPFELLQKSMDRIDGFLYPDAVTNISSLVYLQGWQDLWANLIRTYGMGLGFNMMGCDPLPHSSVREVINLKFQIDKNLQDGSFLLSKIISEFGFIGIVIFLYLFFKLLKSIFYIKKINEGSDIHMSIIICISFLFIFLLSSALRSLGYFNGNIFIMIVAFGFLYGNLNLKLQKTNP